MALEFAHNPKAGKDQGGKKSEENFISKQKNT